MQNKMWRSGRNRAVTLATLIAASVAAAGIALWHFSRPVAQTLRLADGTEAFFYSDTRIKPAATYPDPRTMEIDGEAYLKVPAAATPLIVRTRLLVLTVTGKSAVRIIAHWHETGEQVDVLEGHVEAKKAYKSNYEVPDQLARGQMVMINKTIDLMEKETSDMAELSAWTDAIEAAARTGARK